MLAISVIMMGTLLACGGNLTGPEKELVGTWRLVGFAFGDLEFYNAPRLETRFNSDGTWQGDKGTWQIENNQLTVIDDTGETERWTYFLDGDDLTLILTKAEFLGYLTDVTQF